MNYCCKRFSILFLLTISFLYCRAVFSQPLIEILPEAKFSFGKIYEGSNPNHILKIVNTGTSNLVIQRVQAVCECSLLKLSSTSIQPRDTTTLLVTFLTEGISGEVSKSLYILSNAGNEPRLIIPFTAEVISLVDIYPRSLFFRKQEDTSARKQTMNIMNTGSDTLSFLGVYDSLLLTSTELGKKELLPGEMTFAITTVNNVVNTSKSGKLEFHLSNQRQKTAYVKYYIEGESGKK